MKASKGMVLLVLAFSFFANASFADGSGVVVQCWGASGQFSHQIGVSALADSQGGFREIFKKDGDFGGSVTILGTTTVSHVLGDVYTVVLKDKAYVDEILYGIPTFVEDGHERTLIIDASDRTNIRGRLDGTDLRCK